LSWGPNKLCFAAAAAALIVTSASAASSAILVVRSVGPSAKSFPPGKSLPESSKITLMANDSLIVLDGRGTRTLRGPGTFAPGTRAVSTTRTGLSPLTGAGQPRRARIGAVRSVGSIPRSPSIWHVDIAKSSTVCVDGSGPVQLWRADSAAPATITVTPVGASAAQTIELAAGEAVALWPKTMPITNGASYRLSWPGASAPTALKFATLPSGQVGLEEMASSLIQHGCEAQLDLLIETFRAPDDVEPTTG
jgi:hypothetical protein